jgi:predicted acetyltransferase
VTAGHLEIRPFGPADDVEAELDLRRRAFGPVPAADRPRWIASVQASIDAGQLFGVFDGSRLAASARYFDLRQWWQGRSMPMAGVAGVKVAPEERGRGVGRALMLELLAIMAGRGYPLSTLFPATARLYRGLGWEIAGGKYEAVLPAGELATLLPPDRLAAGQGAPGLPAAGQDAPGLPAAGQDAPGLPATGQDAPGLPATGQDAPGLLAAGRGAAGPVSAPGVRRATAGDGAAVVAALGVVHETLRESGPSTETPDLVSAWLDDHDRFSYLAEDGFLSYRWADRHSPMGGHQLKVDYLAAASAGTARAFWKILSSHAPHADTIRACLPPGDAIEWLTREPVVATRRRDPWMLRVIDARAAIAARGYPAAVAISAQLELADEVRPGNSGRWALEIGGGAGKLTPAAGGNRGPAALRLGPRGLAALFAGAPVGTLRRTGLATGGGPATDAELDSAFGCGQAFMLFEF